LNIICLAWGSLVWDSGVLPAAGPWHTGGPWLPIEFARAGEKGELATVLCPGYPASPARWARLSESNLVTARQLLRKREAIPRGRIDGVGTVLVGQPPGALLGAPEILRWATEKKGIEAVIWTSLPPRFDNAEGRIPSPEEAVRYLLQLTGEVRRHAQQYIRQVPPEIQTANRLALQKAIAS
jgi:hypothetical protein